VNTDVRGRCYAPAGKTPVTFTVGGTRQKLSMIAAYGFLVTERITASKPAGAENTSTSAKFLRFPRITSLAAAQRAQEHVSDSISTIRYQLSFQLIERLGQCPCCGRQNASQLLRHSKTKPTVDVSRSVKLVSLKVNLANAKALNVATHGRLDITPWRNILRARVVVSESKA